MFFTLVVGSGSFFVFFNGFKVIFSGLLMHSGDSFQS